MFPVCGRDYNEESGEGRGSVDMLEMRNTHTGGEGGERCRRRTDGSPELLQTWPEERKLRSNPPPPPGPTPTVTDDEP